MNDLTTIGPLSDHYVDAVHLTFAGLVIGAGYLFSLILAGGVNSPGLTVKHGHITIVAGLLFVDVEGSFHGPIG